MPRRRPPVCRCLFGRPDPGEVDKFLQEANESLQHEAALRWNFDFQAGRPLTDVDEETQRYEWVPVDDHEAVPSAYTNMLETMERSEPNLADATSPDITESSVTLYETSASNIGAANTCSNSCTSSTDTTTAASAATDLENNPPTSCVSLDSSVSGPGN